MPVYHSSFNDFKGDECCGSVILPFTTKFKGPAPPPPQDMKEDIVDEAVSFFRANVLFHNYNVKGPGDRIICYLTVFIGELLRLFQKNRRLDDAQKAGNTLALENFCIPGDARFSLGGFFTAPKNRSEQDLFRSYFKQLRQEVVVRLSNQVYPDANSPPNKWWLSFAKKKFMKIAQA